MKCGLAPVISAGLLACAAADSAFAADIAVPPPPPPPPVVAPAPSYNWSGFFVGGHLGYGWDSEAITLTPDGNYLSGTIVPTIAADPRGLVVGVQYGTNWQFDRLVLGTESDFSFTEIRRSQTILTGGLTNTGEQKLPWFGTTRVRAGYAVQDNLLLYATGGLANGSAEASFSAIGNTSGAVGSRSKTLWGWALGGGLELVARACHHDEIAALRGIALGDAEADPFRCAGDERRPAGEIQFHGRIFSNAGFRAILA